ncbi:MAG: serine/threonine protein kinase [Lachnospiraceae bacterium]|nr:serine/threonine protein kinase [Lachnospiraceae bacterium]
MNDTTFQTLSNYYTILDNLTPNKTYGTYIAMTPTTPKRLIIKEMDVKRASIYAQLSTSWNPYIANVYAVHTFEDCSVAITEYVNGLTLQEYIHIHGLLDIKTALDVCVQLCEGLEEFHKQGFIHKDITPNNIIVCKSKEDSDSIHIKIIDFGIARKFSYGKNSDTEVLGTLGFVAPEVRSATQSNARADIYSIGCILNYMLTGKHPGEMKYCENSAILKLLNNTITLDPQDRYSSVMKLKKEIENVQKKSISSYLPFLKYIPGFRSRTLWKTILALLYYAILGDLFIDLYIQGNYSYFLPYAIMLILPIFIAFNICNIFFFIPHKIKNNSFAFAIIKVILMNLSFFGGMMWIAAL